MNKKKNGLRKQQKETGWGFTVVRSGAEMRIPVCLDWDLSVLNFLMSTEKGASELSSPDVGKEGQGKRKPQKLSAIKHQNGIRLCITRE